MACVPLCSTSSFAPLELDQSEYKSISRGWTEKGQAFSSLCIKVHVLCFPPVNCEYVFGYILEDDTNFRVAFTFTPIFTFLKGPGHNGSLNLIIQCCSRFFL